MPFLIHQERDAEPIAQRPLGILKDRPADDRELIAVAFVTRRDFARHRVDRFFAALANPMKRPMRHVKDLLIAALRGELPFFHVVRSATLVAL